MHRVAPLETSRPLETSGPSRRIGLLEVGRGGRRVRDRWAHWRPVGRIVQVRRVGQMLLDGPLECATWKVRRPRVLGAGAPHWRRRAQYALHVSKLGKVGKARFVSVYRENTAC